MDITIIIFYEISSNFSDGFELIPIEILMEADSAADPPPGGDDRPRGAATRDPGVSDVGKYWNQDGNMMHIW